MEQLCEKVKFELILEGSEMGYSEIWGERSSGREKCEYKDPKWDPRWDPRWDLIWQLN